MPARTMSTLVLTALAVNVITGIERASSADDCFAFTTAATCDGNWLVKACEWNQRSGRCRQGRGPSILREKLEIGSIGDDVDTAQRLLSLKGMNVKRDGIFGTETEKAVKDFQAQKGLSETGKIDMLTRDQLLSR